MSDDPVRTASLVRISKGSYEVSNVRGGVISVGTGENADFTPVELLLAAIAGCSAIDVDFITAKRAEATSFEVSASGEKISENGGSRLDNLAVVFDVRFPAAEDGDRAREALPRSIAQSRDRLCTVSRTVQLGTEVTMGQTN